MYIYIYFKQLNKHKMSVTMFVYGSCTGHMFECCCLIVAFNEIKINSISVYRLK